MNKMFQIISSLTIVIILCLVCLILVLTYNYYKFSKERNPKETSKLVCGTKSTSPITFITHESDALLERECLVCHSRIKDEIVVGPSLYSNEYKKDKLTLDAILLSNSKRLLSTSDNYLRLESRFKFHYHRNNKYDSLSKTELEQLKNYLDTLNEVKE